MNEKKDGQVRIKELEDRNIELEEGIEELLCNFSEFIPLSVISGLQKLLEKR